MRESNNLKHYQIKRPKFKKSILAIAILGFSTTSHGQAEEKLIAEESVTESVTIKEAETEVEVIEVRGTRGNLINARDLKRHSDTVVDSITALDIGSLPDRSVLEAIQRLPGVSVERFAGANDPDHFSVEGSGAIIRGLTQTRSEFNGRDSFSANSGRGLSFQDVSPELMGGVDVFKSQTSDMVEGGIGGTISLRTRKPFDSVDRQIAFNADYSYGDLAQKWSPSFSALYSDQWELDSGGRFGLLVNAADSQLYGESHGVQADAATEYFASEVPGAEAFIGVEGEGTVWIPQAGNALKKFDDRSRKGFSTALQFENADETLLTTFQYLRSDSNLTWHENAIKYQGGYHGIDTRRTGPLEGTEFTFNEEGVFESGTLVENGLDGWRAADGSEDRVPRTWGNNSRQQWGQNTQFDSRIQDSSSLVEDYSLNLEWQATDNLELSADFQYIKAEASNDDLTLMTGAQTGKYFDVSGSKPELTFIEPWLGYRDANPELFAAGSAPVTDNNPDGIYPGFTNDSAGDNNYFSDPNSYYLRSGMDHYERSDGDSVAIRFDSEYHIDDNFITSIQAGIRYANRDQTVRRTGYNWNGLAPEFSDGTGWLPTIADSSYAGNIDEDYEYVDWSDFQGGGVVNVPGGVTISPTAAYVRSLIGANPERQPYTSNANGWDSYANKNSDGPYGLFSDGDINNTEEQNEAIYVRLNFESDDNLRFNGNIGLRYVRLTRTSSGFINFPDLTPDDAIPDGLGMPQQLTNEIARSYIQGLVDNGSYPDLKSALKADENDWVSDPINYLAVNDQNYGNEAEDVLSSKVDFDFILPSFNIKVELTEEVIARFALSKAVALPDIGDVRNQAGIGASVLAFRKPVDLDIAEEDVDPLDSLPLSAIVTNWTGSGGNVELEPMESVQYDIGLEWYFSDVGQLSATIFHKDLKNYFIQGGTTTNYTNPDNGITRPVAMNTTTNGGDGKLDGFEVSYQQFYDNFIPGFGIQATYTYVDAAGVPNNEIAVEDESWAGNSYEDTGIRVSFDTIPLQGQSKKTYNFIAMYEKDEVNARIAYNWRSKYLLTTRDVISKAPLWYDDHGQVDASFFYNFEKITVGVQATNLTNSTSKTLMVLNDDLLETGRSWFEADRRVSFVVRGNF